MDRERIKMFRVCVKILFVFLFPGGRTLASLETLEEEEERITRQRERESDDDGEESAASAEEEEDERRNAVSSSLFFVSQSDLSLLSSRKSD